MKILVAVPSLELVHADFAFSLCGVLNRRAYDRKLSRDVPIALANLKGSLIMTARNQLVQTAKDLDASHIWFVDSDVAFPPETLDTLIAHHVPIVGCTYAKRFPPHAILGHPLPNAAIRAGLLPMLSLPLGMALISMKIFPTLPEPYFAYLEAANPRETVSEDTYFCNAARAVGHTIHLDVNLSKSIGHIGSKTFFPGALS